ncbi:MAG TPA: cell wall hydrolase [Rhizobiaceae bacterium]
MLQGIQRVSGQTAKVRERPDPAAPIVIRIPEATVVDVAEPQPPMPSGAAGLPADWAFVKVDDSNGTAFSGWLERKFLGKAERPVIRIDEAEFIQQCVRVETRYNAGGNDDGFPVDADYLIAWALIASGMSDLPPDPDNDGAGGPFALTDAEWRDYADSVGADGDPPSRDSPLMHPFAAAHLSRKRMQELSDKLTDLALEDGPYIPTYLNVIHAQLIGVDAAADVQKALAAKEGAVTMDALLAKTVPDQAARDAVTKRHEKFLKDGAKSQTVEGFRSKTSRLLNERFTRAFKLIKRHMPETIPPKADIGATGSWLEAAEKELKAWEEGKLKQNSGEGKGRVLDYFKATDLRTDKVLSWCGAFVAHCLKEAGEPAAASIIKGASWAANWKGWGDTKLFLRTGAGAADGIPQGAIVLLEPLVPKASGHVGFFHSLKEGNRIVLLGGNQSGKVCLRAFPRGKLVAIRWLAAAPQFAQPQDDTPVAAGDAAAGGTPVAGATNQDVIILARTLYGEARGEFDAEGKGDKAVEAVANVILNRVAKKFRGRSTVRDVCLHAKQFSCWNGNDVNRRKIMNLVKGADSEFDRCLAVATRAIRGEFPDHTDGALHYFARRIPKPPWVLASPDAKVTLTIGGHVFYKGIK